MKELKFHGKSIIIGRGSISAVKDLGAKRVFLVTGGKSMFENGSVAKIEALLKEQGAAVLVQSGIPANPPVLVIEQGIERMKAFAPDAVIGIGGGSAMDAAKMMALFYEHPELDIENQQDMKGVIAMILDKLNLTGRVAIVTGASRGLGAGMAIGLAEAGADLVVVASSARLQETVEKIKALGRRCIGVQADLSDMKVIPGIIEATLKEYGRLDILINCAGIIRRAPAIEFSEKDWDDVIQINQKATFFMCQAAAREMVKQKKGKIVNIASLLSFQGGIIVPSYTASKSAVAGITKALANEWAPLGINVNAIAPGYMATELTEALQKNPERSTAILARIPTGRWGTPEDMKGLGLLLVSDAAEYIQGQVIGVDGGWMGR